MYTFDIFDTLITRKTATPLGIFALVQSKLQQEKKYSEISEYIRNNFYHLRINSEKLARHSYRSKGAEDITLEQIYEAMSMTGSMSQTEINQLMELERLTEYENVIGIAENIEKLKSRLVNGDQVVLISDMYLDSKTIKDMLVKVDPIFKSIPLYVSGEYQKSKWVGTLYQTVKEKEQAEYKDWVHTGDNLYSDIKGAQRFGIQTKLFDYEPLLGCEKKALENNEANFFVQLTIGTARNTRLKEKLKGPAAIGCSIGGGILFPYVWWIIQESIKKGIKRLYFIARDGFVLKKIADIIIEKCSYDIETYYIYGSRKVWRIPSISETNSDLMKFIRWTDKSKIRDVKGLADFFEIPVKQLIRFLPIALQDQELKLKSPLIAILVKGLNENQDFKKYLYQEHEEKRKKVVAYLKQEINVADDAFAFVDLAGGGFTQGCMADIMSDFYPKKVRNFFFKLDQINLMSNCIYYNFVPSFLYLNLIIEMLCRAPHGQTICYCQKDCGIIPVIYEEEGSALVEHGFNEYLRGIESFTKTYCEVIKTHSIVPDSLKIVLQYMDYITKTPDAEVLEFLAGMTSNESEREQEIVEFAPVLSKKDIFSIFLWRTSEPIKNYYKGSSLDYSLLRCSPDDKRKIDYYMAQKKMFLGKVVYLLKNIIQSKRDYHLAVDFPCEILPKRVVLYGAGKFGQDLYKKLKDSKDHQVVQWVDRDYRKYKTKWHKVSNPSSIGEVEYDSIVIAVIDEKLAISIRKALIKQGIEEENILWINLRPRWV